MKRAGKFFVVTLGLGLLSGYTWCAAQEQGAKAQRNPVQGKPEAIRDGRANFRINCAMCHGSAATGGLRGPSLVTGRLIHGSSDEALYNLILRGILGTLMPANDLSDDETWEIISYLRTLQPKARPAATGDPAEGGKFFFGEGYCSACHMVRGRGGRVGPDLSRVAEARSQEYIIESLREPDRQISEGLSEPGRDFPMTYEIVTVTLADGAKLTGIARNEDSFSIQLMDGRENLHLLLKKDLKSVVHEGKSFMPAYGPAELPDAKLRGLLAYLETLRGE
ncbi:MAG: c-type cytochrome [Acidobacteriia bacterium]|nr:c-type cytochrome [Terriglobia bacterium]